MSSTTNWVELEGQSITGEDDVAVYGRDLDGGNYEVAYCAYGGLKIVTINTDGKLVPAGTGDAISYDTTLDSCGGEDEVVFAIKKGNEMELFVVNCCGEIWAVNRNTSISVDVTETAEYSVDEFDEVDEQLLIKFSYI